MKVLALIGTSVYSSPLPLQRGRTRNRIGVSVDLETGPGDGSTAVTRQHARTLHRFLPTC